MTLLASVLVPGKDGADLDCALPDSVEVIVVGDTSGRPSTGGATKQVASDAPITRRINIGIALARGRWVIILCGDAILRTDWVSQVCPVLVDNADPCAIVFRGAAGGILWAVRRCAFAYGSLDDRIASPLAALTHWRRTIFPAHPYRKLDCEGIRDMPASFILGGAKDIQACEETAAVDDARKPRQDEDYQPRRFWEENTGGYVKWEVFQPDEAEIADAVTRTQPGSVLELGCGAGRNIRYLDGGMSYVGIDLSMNLLRRAREKRVKDTVHLVCANATCLPFADNSFDLVFADSTIQHVAPEAIEACVAEMLRVSTRYVCLIEYTDELSPDGGWFRQIHMFRHDYPVLMQHACAAPGAVKLLRRQPTNIAVQPAVKEYFLFEKSVAGHA